MVEVLPGGGTYTDGVVEEETNYPSGGQDDAELPQVGVDAEPTVSKVFLVCLLWPSITPEVNAAECNGKYRKKGVLPPSGMKKARAAGQGDYGDSQQ